MPDYRRRKCDVRKGGCGKSWVDVGPISWGGLCYGCGKEKVNTNVTQMEAHAGPNFDRWRVQLAASVGGTLVDSPPDRT